MTKIFYCLRCRCGWQLVGELGEVTSILSIIGTDSSPACITPMCSGRLCTSTEVPYGFDIQELPARSFYRAIHGFGVGEGDPAAASEFARLLKTKKIVDMVVTAVGQPERVIVHQLVLEDGTRMHFDSSSRGACCYYIERPGKSCMEVVEDELATVESSVSSVGSNREEARRGDAGAERSPGCEPDPGLEHSAGPQSAGTEPVRFVRQDPFV